MSITSCRDVHVIEIQQVLAVIEIQQGPEPVHLLLARSRSSTPYKNQDQHKGSCAKCGRVAKKVTRLLNACRLASESEERVFFKKVKESKAKKSKDGTTKSNKNVKFDKAKRMMVLHLSRLKCNIDGVG